MVYINKELSSKFEKNDRTHRHKFPLWERGWEYKYKWLVIIGIIFIVSLAWGPLSDWLTVKSAKPEAIKLVKESGMSHTGELIFLRARPQLDSDAQLSSDCPASSANNLGYLEQGCYDPNSSRIYLRNMPDSLHSSEIATAAYEMLHPVYESIVSSGDTRLNSIIEAEYKSHSGDSSLKALVKAFAKTEPGARDEELFSIFGVNYSDISTDLYNYYMPYFADRNLTTAADNQVDELFRSYSSQLKQLKATIKHDHDLANTAYYDSLSWANVGNQYETNYNYNIYRNDINLENEAVNQFNQILDNYNTLVEQYNGTQPISPISNAQPK